MASLSNINGLFDVHSTGAILFSTSHGTSGQILRSNGNAAPTWVTASTVIGGPYLPLTGGTLSGPLSGTSLTLSGTLSGTTAIFNTGAGDVGLGVYTSAVSTIPNVRFGRNSGEYIGFKIQDRNNRIVFRQDETTGNHEAVFDIWSSTTGNRAFVLGASDNAGASFSNWLTIENGAASFTGLVSGITPTAAANFTTKAYVDSVTPGAGPFLPLAGGVLTGGLAGLYAKFTQGVYDDSSGIRVSNPGGGSRTTQTSVTTGAIKITLPVSWTNTMIRMTIKVYEYTTNESFTVVCGGYNYSPSSAWINEFAYIESSGYKDRNFTVRMGHDGTKCCIYIGELTSTWTYTQIFVTDFQGGFSGLTASNWRSGWVVGFEASAFGTITYTETNPQINNWARSGNNVYYGSGTGNVGIGTSNPLAPLTIGSGSLTDGNIPVQISTSGGTSQVWYGVNKNGGYGLLLGRHESGIGGGGAGSYIRNIPEDPLYFMVSNTGLAMTILPNENVGIGTATPETPLHVLSNTTDNASTMLIQNGSTGDASIKFNISGDTYSIGIDNSDSDKFKLSYGAVGTTDRIVVDTSGNVGIGTSSPGAKLEVNGDILLTYLKATGNCVIGGSNLNSSRLSVQDSKNGTANSPHFQILGNGYSAYHYLDTTAYNIVTNSTTREIRVIAQNGGVKLAYAATAWAANSDIALKENIKPLENVLDKIKDYRCVEYNLKESPEDKKIGFIAQDWVDDFPAIVDKDEKDMLGMKYTETIPVLLKAIQELTARIKELENK